MNDDISVILALLPGEYQVDKVENVVRTAFEKGYNLGTIEEWEKRDRYAV